MMLQSAVTKLDGECSWIAAMEERRGGSLGHENWNWPAREWDSRLKEVCPEQL